VTLARDREKPQEEIHERGRHHNERCLKIWIREDADDVFHNEGEKVRVRSLQSPLKNSHKKKDAEDIVDDYPAVSV
jgi:hypothetical protein